MFAKIIDNPQLSQEEQRQVLKDVIHNNIKHNIPEVRLQLTHHYATLRPVLLKHWKQSLRIVLSLFNWQTARDFLAGNTEGNVCFDLLISICSAGQDASTRGTYLMCELAKTYKEYWKALSILQISADVLCERISNSEDYNWFLASFVSISANVIQNYLSIKAGPKSGETDRPESDLALVSNCEEWVTRCYLKVFGKLRAPATPSSKRSLLSAFSQILGALYESQRENHLNVDRLHEIMAAAGRYVLQHYTVQEVSQIFLSRLRELKYNNPPKKIQIPERYSQQSELNTEGICWIINLFEQEGSQVYSPSKQLQLSLLAYSELLPYPLKLKNTLFNRIKAHFQNKVRATSQFQVGYPLGLLLFQVHHFDRLAYDSVALGLDLGTNEERINRLRRLIVIKIQNLNVEKLTFVLQQLNQPLLVNRQALLLFKSINFDFVSADLTKEVLRVAESLLANHGQLARDVVATVLEKEKLAKHNPELCSQLQKKLQ